jgi:hypothetical protein
VSGRGAVCSPGSTGRSAHVDQEIADPDLFGQLYPALLSSKELPGL